MSLLCLPFGCLATTRVTWELDCDLESDSREALAAKEGEILQRAAPREGL